MTAEAQVGAMHPPGGQPRILVVDDQSTVRAILRELLGAMGCAVSEAASGTEALASIEQESFALVTLDMVLPDIPGLEVLRRVRALRSYSDLPIVVISIQDRTGDIVEALTLGANDYVTKPINREVLAARLRTHLWHGQSERALRDLQQDLENRVRERTVELEKANRALRDEIAERRRAEEATSQYAMMINTASDLLSLVDRDYRYVAVNTAFLTATDLSAEEVHGRDMSQLFGREVFENEIRAKVDLSFQGMRVATLLETDLADAGKHSFDLRFDPHRDENGEVTGVVVTARDVSERQQADNALRALAQSGVHRDTDAFLRTCVSALANTYRARHVIIAMHDRQHDEMRTLAVWREDRYDDNFSFRFGDEPCIEVLSSRTSLVERNVVDVYPQFGLLSELGADSYFGCTLRAQNDTPIGIVAVIDTAPMEINAWSRPILGIFANRIAMELERSQALQASEYSSSLHRATLESTGTGILVVDQDLRVQSYNRMYLKMWQLSDEAVAGFADDVRKAIDLVAAQLADPQRFRQVSREIFAHTEEDSLDTLYFRDGRVYERYSTPHRLGGRVIGRVVSYRDMSERVRAERELEEYKDNLEELVRARTAELEAINKEIASFSYSVSHDLRAPLRAIDGFSQMLLEDHGGSLDDNALVYLQRIRDASQRMGTLIDDVLLLSRLSRRELSIQDVDLAAIAGDITRKLAEAEPARKVEIELPGELHARADPHLAGILLQNLLGNAWKYTRKQKRARIWLGARRDGVRTVFYVGDNGVGFDMKYANKLFQPFQRLHSITEFEGTGVGLATVAQIVHRHGGTVTAEGKLNAGATVYFTLTD